jgi:hypothetical protein
LTGQVGEIFLTVDTGDIRRGGDRAVCFLQVRQELPEIRAVGVMVATLLLAPASVRK